MLPMFSSALARLSRAGRVCQSASAFTSAACSDVVPSTAMCCLKESRAVLKIKGQDTSTFLQGLLSNDVRAMPNDGAPGIMYSLMLNSQGRFAYDVFLHRQQGEAPDSIMLDVDREHLGKLTKLLQMYKLRSKVDILNVSDNHEVWVAPGSGGFSSDPAEAAEAEGLQWMGDPRLPDLGARTILPAGYIPLGKVVAPQAFKDLRFRLGVPEGCSEIPSGEALPLEYNLDALNGVSYTKGCYVGQELTARTHFRGVIRKRIMPVSFLAASPSSQSSSSGKSLIGAQVTAEGAKRPVGKVTAMSAQGDTGLAVLRLDSAAAAMEGSMELLVGGGLRVDPRVPAWWPAEWMAAAADGAPEAE